MIKMLSFKCQQCLAHLSCCLLKVPLKRDFLNNYLTTFFGLCNLRHTSSITLIFFLKMLKYNLDFKNAETRSEQISCFWDNCIWIGCIKFSLLRREYLSSAVNVLKNSSKSFHISKRDFLQPNCLHYDQLIW